MPQTPHQGLPGAGNGRDSHTGIFPVLLAQSQGEIWFCSNHHVSSTAAKLHPKSFLLPAQLPLSKSCQFINDQALIADQSAQLKASPKPSLLTQQKSSFSPAQTSWIDGFQNSFRIHFAGAKIVLFQPKPLQTTPKKKGDDLDRLKPPKLWSSCEWNKVQQCPALGTPSQSEGAQIPVWGHNCWQFLIYIPVPTRSLPDPSHWIYN